MKALIESLMSNTPPLLATVSLSLVILIIIVLTIVSKTSLNALKEKNKELRANLEIDSINRSKMIRKLLGHLSETMKITDLLEAANLFSNEEWKKLFEEKLPQEEFGRILRYVNKTTPLNDQYQAISQKKEWEEFLRIELTPKERDLVSKILHYSKQGSR